MKVAVVVNRTGGDSRPDETDVAAQARCVTEALTSLDHSVVTVECSPDLSDLTEKLARLKPDAAFNLVESAFGSDRFAYLAAGMLEALGIPFTGNDAESMILTDNKLLAKEILSSQGLPTPQWITNSRNVVSTCRAGDNFAPDSEFIIKPTCEHASVGMTQDSIAAYIEVEDKLSAAGRGYFAERYIEGREFNISIIGIEKKPFVLPPAEIDFSNYPAGMRRIVDYSAKWQADSFEFNNTPRSFDFDSDDGPLLNRLEELCRRCWYLFDLAGYARVDFRVDDNGQPWILEINSNPCLSPDAGFSAALDRAGISFGKAVDFIVAAAIDRLRETLPDRGRTDHGQTDARSEIQREPVTAQPAASAGEPVLRNKVENIDLDNVRRLVNCAGNFNPAEIEIAIELIEEYLKRGKSSGYRFIFADINNHTAGYICYGPVPLTASAYDIYWIAVDPAYRRRGLGRQLLAACERDIAAHGGTDIYIDTSGKVSYSDARGFYLDNGYEQASFIADFYDVDDAKIIYRKRIASRT